MPHHHETRLLPWSQEQLYDLVADIERYPEFLPWCQAVRIRRRAGAIVESDMVIGTRALCETVRTEGVFTPPHAIVVRYLDGPLQTLQSSWHFAPHRDGCQIMFDVSVTPRTAALRIMVSILFERAYRRMVTAFEQRAHELYG